MANLGELIVFYDGSLWKKSASTSVAHRREDLENNSALRESLSALQLVSARQAQAHKTRRLQCPSARCLKKGGLERT